LAQAPAWPPRGAGPKDRSVFIRLTVVCVVGKFGFAHLYASAVARIKHVA
jgi:hypothetical protein